MEPIPAPLRICFVCGAPARFVNAAGPAFPYCSRACQELDCAEAHKRAHRRANIMSAPPPSADSSTLSITVIDDISSEAGQVGVQIALDQRFCMDPALRWGRTRQLKLATRQITYTAMGAIGKGAYGLVIRKTTPDGASIAIKYSQINVTESIPYEAYGDLELRNLDHPNVIGICGAGIARDEMQKITAPPKWFAIVMDEASLDLHDFLRRRHRERNDIGLRGVLDPDELKLLAYQVVRGVAYCHSRLVLNLDCKPNNFLITGAQIAGEPRLVPRVMVADLGHSRSLCTEPIPVNRQYMEYYRPPEALLHQGRLRGAYQGEVWAIGCVLYEMAVDTHLVEAKDRTQHMRQLVELFGVPSHTMRNKWLPGWGNIFGPIYEQHTVVGAFDGVASQLAGVYPGLDALLERMLDMDPDRRCTLFEALDHPYFALARARIEAQFPSAAPIMPLTFTADNCVVPARAIEALFSMQTESWKVATPDDPTPEYEGVNMALVNAWVRGNPIYGSLALFASLAFARSLSLADYRPRHERWDYVQGVCYRIALRTRTPCTGWLPADYANEAAAQKFHRIERECMTALDYDFTQPTAFDFYRQYAKQDMAIGPAERAAGTLVLLVACLNYGMASKMPPSDLALNSLGYVRRHQGGVWMPTGRPFVARPAVCIQLDRLVRRIAMTKTPLQDYFLQTFRDEPGARDHLASAFGEGDSFLI